MDEGNIILDVKGEEKKQLTVFKLVELFKKIKNKDYASDEDLLAP
ncbi:MAG: ABC transporter ATP-binding protein, partial [Spirochaetia bacterium]|nr:ABC transporter ATP-binding protein [Spirochaetia bacterium]